MNYLFTSESVSEGHPDKVADQISDAVLDAFLAQDPHSKVACETLVTTRLAIVCGEVKSTATVNVEQIAREVIRRIGYTKPEYLFDDKSCEVISRLHEQSPDINQGVVREKDEDQGAGDQGMMFGYAINETRNYMPLTMELSHLLLWELAAIRKEGKQMTYLRPDAKSQVTIEYDGKHRPVRIHTIVVSTQHDDFGSEKEMQDRIKKDVQDILIPRVKKQLDASLQKLFGTDYILHVNPTGRFVIGGPHGDTGLTGRKIIVDTYGGRAPHGGGAFSGKDSSKVDRSAAYAARHIAKNLVAAGVADEVLVQVAYAIGVAQPVSVYVNTFGTAKVKDVSGKVMKDAEIAEKSRSVFDLRPRAIVERLGLRNPIFFESASYGHIGREPGKKKIEVQLNGKKEAREYETFTWEKLDYVPRVKEAFGMTHAVAE